MVGLLTFGSRKFESLHPLMQQTIVPLHGAMQQLLPLVDQDAQAFSDYEVKKWREGENVCVGKGGGGGSFATF